MTHRVEPRDLPGWPLYDRLCLACHGAAGDGRGPAAPFTWGIPRDLTSGAYAWRSTPVGQPPTDDDLRATLRHGARGTSMPGFDDVLSDDQLDQLVAVIKAFAPDAFATRSSPVTPGPPPPPDMARGAALWTQAGCAHCHGAGGTGEVTGLTIRPYDLTTRPLQRPRATDDREARRRAAVTSIATGLAGTPMPGYAGQLADRDLWALADHVVSLGARAARTDRSALDRETIDADRTARLATGTWPGDDPLEARIFGAPVAPQGTPPALAPAQTSLSASQCARCHAKQEREWRGSVHAAASTWGLPAREADHALDGDASCNRCHTPLAEQQPGASFDAALRAEGINCAGCHVRGWVRHGPPARAPSLLPAPGYPLVELALYERSDFCMTCHQLPPRTAVNGKPLLNTYKEWLEGPYMRRGIQCQHCHMPDREHSWKGVHDRDTVRQGIALDATARRARGDGAVTVVANLTNIGAGHYLPTTATPALYLRIELVDGQGAAIHGARAELRIGREISYERTGWVEHRDSRIPPGERVTMARAWTAGGVARAVAARITVEVHPEHFYEQMYGQRLAAKLPAATRAAYTTALARAKAARFIAEQVEVPVALP